MNEHRKKRKKNKKSVEDHKEAELVDTKVHVFTLSFFVNRDFTFRLKLYWTL